MTRSLPSPEPVSSKSEPKPGEVYVNDHPGLPPVIVTQCAQMNQYRYGLAERDPEAIYIGFSTLAQVGKYLEREGYLTKMEASSMSKDSATELLQSLREDTLRAYRDRLQCLNREKKIIASIEHDYMLAVEELRAKVNAGLDAAKSRSDIIVKELAREEELLVRLGAQDQVGQGWDEISLEIAKMQDEERTLSPPSPPQAKSEVSEETTPSLFPTGDVCSVSDLRDLIMSAKVSNRSKAQDWHRIRKFLLKYASSFNLSMRSTIMRALRSEVNAESRTGADFQAFISCIYTALDEPKWERYLTWESILRLDSISEIPRTKERLMIGFAIEGAILEVVEASPRASDRLQRTVASYKCSELPQIRQALASLKVVTFGDLTCHKLWELQQKRPFSSWYIQVMAAKVAAVDYTVADWNKGKAQASD